MTAIDNHWQGPLLGPEDPPPYEVLKASAPSQFFLTCDHASRRFPSRLGTLGLAPGDQDRHIAWDIGAAGVARGLSEILDATLVLQTYSRLVVDCNRTPEADDFIASKSEDTLIPGNQRISAAEANARTCEIFRPYHAMTSSVLDARAAAKQETVLVAVHTCTDVFHGVWRPWHVGVLYDRDDRFARTVLEVLGQIGELTVGENKPYSLSHTRDYSVPVHAEVRGLPHVELEIRQDLVATAQDQEEWAHRIALVLRQAYAKMVEQDG